MKFRGDGEWLARKHGSSRRRQWRKVHIAMDTETGNIRAVGFTSGRRGDSRLRPDLSVVRYISHRIAVMYLGRIVEIGDAEDVWNGRLHPYTRALVNAIPDEAARKDDVQLLEGDVPGPVNPPSGCPFRTRCAHSRDECAVTRPELRTVGTHEVACHFAEEFV